VRSDATEMVRVSLAQFPAPWPGYDLTSALGLPASGRVAQATDKTAGDARPEREGRKEERNRSERIASTKRVRERLVTQGPA
jgi:hypothetical protein